MDKVYVVFFHCCGLSWSNAPMILMAKDETEAMQKANEASRIKGYRNHQPLTAREFNSRDCFRADFLLAIPNNDARMLTEKLEQLRVSTKYPHENPALR